MNVHPEKVGYKNGEERFMLVDAKTKTSVTTTDHGEASLRKYLKQGGAGDELLDRAFARARKRYEQTSGADSAFLEDMIEDVIDDSDELAF